MWDMDEPAAGCNGAIVMEDKAEAAGAQRGANDGTVFSTYQGAIVVERNGDAPCPFGTDDSGRYKFFNWSNKIVVGGPGNPSTDYEVEDSGTTASKRSRVSVVDSGKLLNPGMSSFRMTTRFKPLNVWRTINGVTGWFLPDFSDPDGATLNMFQRGKAGGAGGQYKMELVADAAARGMVRCTFRDSQYDVGAPAAERAKHEVVITADVATNFHATYTSKVECGLNRATNKAFLTVVDNHTGPGVNDPADDPGDPNDDVLIPADFGTVDPYGILTSEQDFTVGSNYGFDESDTYSGNFYYIKLDVGA